ncbi:MAG: hypothetical protein ACLS3M_04430 [Collinsella sp.]
MQSCSGLRRPRCRRGRGPIAKGIIVDVTAELEVFDPGFTCTVEIADDAEVEAMDQKSALALIRAPSCPLTA